MVFKKNSYAIASKLHYSKTNVSYFKQETKVSSTSTYTLHAYGILLKISKIHLLIHETNIFRSSTQGSQFFFFNHTNIYQEDMYLQNWK